MGKTDTRGHDENGTEKRNTNGEEGAVPKVVVEKTDPVLEAIIESKFNPDGEPIDDSDPKSYLIKSMKIAFQAESTSLPVEGFDAYIETIYLLSEQCGIEAVNFVGLDPSDLDRALDIYRRYNAEFPQGYFLNTIREMIPKAMRIEQEEGDFDQFLELFFETLHQYEPTVKEKEDERLAEFEEISTQLKDLSDKSDPASAIRKGELSDKLDFFMWSDTEYRPMIRLLKYSPNLGFFNEATRTVISLNADREQYSRAPFYYYEDVFRSFTDNRRNTLKEFSSIDSFIQYNNKLLESVSLKDDPSEVVYRGLNLWGTSKASSGIGDFVHECLLCEMDPLAVNDAIDLAKMIPSNSLGRLEQNREDAKKLPFGIRDFIHDQLPDVHALMVAIIHFYETGDDTLLAPIVSRYWDQDEKERYLKPEEILDREFYDTEAGADGGEDIIDVIRRLETNTDPIPEEPPETGRDQLDQQLLQVHISVDHRGIASDSAALHGGLVEINRILDDMNQRQEIGVEPNFVLALGWLEYQTSQAIRDRLQFNRSEEALNSLFQEDWFQESIRFFLMTNTTAAIENGDIEKFIESIQSSASSNIAYSKLSEKVIETVSLLSAIRTTQNRSSDNLWTGNLCDAFIMLGDESDPVKGYARKRELLSRIEAGKEEALLILDQPVEAYVDEYSVNGPFIEVKTGENEIVDMMHQLFIEVSSANVSDLSKLKDQYVDQWDIGSTVRAMGYQGDLVRYNGVTTPIRLIDIEYNGRILKAAFTDEAGITFGCASVDGQIIQNKDELIRELRLPKVYQNASREGD